MPLKSLSLKYSGYFARNSSILDPDSEILVVSVGISVEPFFEPHAVTDSISDAAKKIEMNFMDNLLSYPAFVIKVKMITNTSKVNPMAEIAVIFL